MRFKYKVKRSSSSNIRRIAFSFVLFLSFFLFGLSPKAQNVTHFYAPSSQLSAGTWARVGVSAPGICRITYEELVNMQLPVAGIASNLIRVHGYGGLLPENAGAFRYDDLPEVAVRMFDGGDNSFNPGDYLLFWSSGPQGWKYNNQFGHYESVTNIYSDQAYYFITAGSTAGRRISTLQQPTSSTQQIEYYNYREVINPELYNLIKSGRGWYGDVFDIITQRDYTFRTANLRPGSDLQVRFSAVARSSNGSSFTLSINGQDHLLPFSPISSEANTHYAFISTKRLTQPAPAKFTKASVKYNKLSSLDLGWLNFIEVNAEAKLLYDGNQLQFRRNGPTGTVEYKIDGAGAGMYLWDITDPLSPGEINATVQNNTLLFKANADTVREYILADASNLVTPVFIENVANQNLHNLQTPQMLIISPPDFMNEAVRLATFHSNRDDLSVSVVTPQAIYNEFSSGSQDISAIRDFIKMLWHKAEPNNLPRYVLLFGDASYDFKNRIPGNTNVIPTWQSPESLHPVYSLATDDFFVCIDDHEGGLTEDVVDIGIGRLPVVTPEEATRTVDKIIHYAMDTENVNGDWRNVIVFVADDQDGNIHMSQADQIATMIDTVYRNYNTDKIFLDAYMQESTAGGQRSPDANAALNQRVNKGALIINYTGHGGETGWTHEQILEVKDIVEWSNWDRLPVFMTATCEFSRYDDPVRVSGGEYAFLNPNGGAIALFTTSRPTYGTPNFTLARNFYNIALQPANGGMPRLGDIIRLAKVQSGHNDNTKKFILLGNPAMTMAYPAHKVITTSINAKPAYNSPDTLKAMQFVTIKGIIAGNNDVKMEDFNGTIHPTVFDKQSNIATFGSDGNSVMSFSLWRNIIYKGRAEVKNGEFSFSFIVPRDIAYNYGPGKISYYATDGTTDATGNYSSLTVGGFSDEEILDFEGPEVTLFINDSSFKPGGFTDENPVLLAYITDSSGVNTIGNSIGHDIVAILDDDTQNPYILNDYYEADRNTYKSGSIRFPMFKLPAGHHTLKLRLWDVNNNSAEVSTHFVVAPKDQLVLSELEAWPVPMHDDITFAIGHNQAGKELKASLSVYNLTGSMVATHSKTLLAGGFRTQVFRWDGTGPGGYPLTPGFYIANLRVETPEGFVSDKSVKIIIAR